jgi:arylsulfatase
MEFGLKQLLDDRGLIKHQYSENHGADELNELVSWKLDEDVISDKFFLFMNYMEVHGYGAPRELVEDWVDYDEAREVLEDLDLIPDLSEEEKDLLVGLYDGQIRYTDIRLKNLVERVRDKHPDTVFIFTSDHGQNSGHYGVRNHQYGIWERLIRVPLVIWGEDIPDVEIEQNVALRDLHDLILGKTEVEDLGKEKIFAEYYGAKNFTVKYGGRDIERYPEEKRHLLENTSKAVVKGRRGYINNSHIDDFVFEAGMDGFSEESLDPDDHQDLRQEIEERFGDREGSSDDVERSKDEEVKDKLKDLGYMQ